MYPVRGIEPDGAQVLLCAIMERCVFAVSYTHLDVYKRQVYIRLEEVVLPELNPMITQ